MQRITGFKKDVSLCCPLLKCASILPSYNRYQISPPVCRQTGIIFNITPPTLPTYLLHSIPSQQRSRLATCINNISFLPLPLHPCFIPHLQYQLNKSTYVILQRATLNVHSIKEFLTWRYRSNVCYFDIRLPY